MEAPTAYPPFEPDTRAAYDTTVARFRKTHDGDETLAAWFHDMFALFDKAAERAKFTQLSNDPTRGTAKGKEKSVVQDPPAVETEDTAVGPAVPMDVDEDGAPAWGEIKEPVPTPETVTDARVDAGTMEDVQQVPAPFAKAVTVKNGAAKTRGGTSKRGRGKPRAAPGSLKMFSEDVICTRLFNPDVHYMAPKPVRIV